MQNAGIAALETALDKGWDHGAQRLNSRWKWVGDRPTAAAQVARSGWSGQVSPR